MMMVNSQKQEEEVADGSRSRKYSVITPTTTTTSMEATQEEFESNNYNNGIIINNNNSSSNTGDNNNGIHDNNNNTDACKWTSTKTNILIAAWQTQKVLYDPTHPNYGCNRERDKAVVNIQRLLAEKDFHCSMVDITAKMLILESLCISSKIGTGSYTCRFLTPLSFLEQHVQHKGFYRIKRPTDDGKLLSVANQLPSMNYSQPWKNVAIITPINHPQAPATHLPPPSEASWTIPQSTVTNSCTTISSVLYSGGPTIISDTILAVPEPKSAVPDTAWTVPATFSRVSEDVSSVSCSESTVPNVRIPLTPIAIVSDNFDDRYFTDATFHMLQEIPYCEEKVLVKMQIKNMIARAKDLVYEKYRNAPSMVESCYYQERS